MKRYTMQTDEGGIVFWVDWGCPATRTDPGQGPIVEDVEIDGETLSAWDERELLAHAREIEEGRADDAADHQRDVTQERASE